ncbi:hypothetical protein, partial [Bifidobacterium mongoliense]|uniref:hypothetical protein n=1 Tax=Bifidobacterium mongoliense TaxID=518643 RepID=UPI00264A0220
MRSSSQQPRDNAGEGRDEIVSHDRVTDGHLVHPQVVIHVASDGIDGIVIAQVVDVDGADTEAGVTESGVHRGRRNGDADD